MHNQTGQVVLPATSRERNLAISGESHWSCLSYSIVRSKRNVLGMYYFPMGGAWYACLSRPPNSQNHTRRPTITEFLQQVRQSKKKRTSKPAERVLNFDARARGRGKLVTGATGRAAARRFGAACHLAPPASTVAKAHARAPPRHFLAPLHNADAVVGARGLLIRRLASRAASNWEIISYVRDTCSTS